MPGGLLVCSWMKTLQAAYFLWIVWCGQQSYETLVDMMHILMYAPIVKNGHVVASLIFQVPLSFTMIYTSVLFHGDIADM